METNDWNDAERRVERAQELFEQRKWQEALDELRAATNINPYNASWYFNIGLTLDELGRFEEAIGAYEQALAIDAEDLHALHHLFPMIPFHNMPEAHRRISAALPAGSPYHAAEARSFFAEVGRFMVRRGDREAAGGTEAERLTSPQS